MTGAGGPRVLLAAGRRDLERRLSRELQGAGIEVGGRCLDGPSLLERASEPDINVVLASAELHRLTRGVLAALSERGTPVVLLAAGAEDASGLAGLGRVLPASSQGSVVAAALRQAAAAGAVSPGFEPGPDPDAAAGAARGPDGRPAALPPSAARAAPAAGGRVVAVTSGKGAPGKTTVAIALAALLGEQGTDVVLVDADLRGGNVAPYLDLDPRLGLMGLAAAGGRLDRELQEGPGCSVLAGVERPELAAGLAPEALREVTGELSGRFDAVVADLGAPPEPGLLEAADELLLVTGADLISVWNARTALPAIRAHAAARPRAVVNRREGAAALRRARGGAGARHGGAGSRQGGPGGRAAGGPAADPALRLRRECRLGPPRAGARALPPRRGRPGPRMRRLRPSG